MPQNYTPEFKKKIVRLHEEEGRTYKSITAEYGVSKAAISAWCKQFRDECQKSPELKNKYDFDFSFYFVGGEQYALLVDMDYILFR